jgi:DNA-binding transcriptional MerR regulator
MDEPPVEPSVESSLERDPTDRRLTVGALAEVVGVTVRTLHHYDEIGLVRPSERSGSGYRLYTPADVTRLQHVVVYRRLGMSLEQIGALLDGDEPVAAHLRRQREAVAARVEELRDLVVAIDRALEKELTGMQLSRDEQKELFGDNYDEAWATEAQERWGDTEAWKQSQRRTAGYGKADWVLIQAEAEQIGADFVTAMQGGAPADGDVAMDVAERHRAHITRWFYDCPPAMHRGLGEMYVADERFTRTYEDQAPGLAQYVRDAVVANADRQS